MSYLSSPSLTKFLHARKWRISETKHFLCSSRNGMRASRKTPDIERDISHQPSALFFWGNNAARMVDSKTTLSRLHFYMHDVVGTSNATAIQVAGPTSGSIGPILVFDDKLTAESSADSQEVGRAQGTYVSDSMSKISLLFSFTAVFPNGTVSLHGQDPIFDKTREFAVIGGTGAFRFATGYATVETASLSGLTAVLDINVYFRSD